jgi:hypothetical protein
MRAFAVSEGGNTELSEMDIPTPTPRPDSVAR